MSSPKLVLDTIGSQTDAGEVFRRMLSGSKAYAEHVARAAEALGKPLYDLSWRDIPIVTKANFYSRHPWRELVPRESYRDIYSILRSSGSTSVDGKAKGFFWPQLKSVDTKLATAHAQTLVKLFSLDTRKTLAIVALSLGSWAGGEQIAFVFRSLAMQAPFPLVVFSPGNEHAEVLEIIEKAHAEFDQILIALCPSAIFYLERLAEKQGIALPYGKITFLVTGEPFSEPMRQSLQQRSGRFNVPDISILGVYGAADAGNLGLESLPLIAVRQALGRHPRLAEELGFPVDAIPNLYHAQSETTFFEKVNGELVLTRWQGLPLVRYNLKDRVQFFSWKGICTRLAQEDPDHSIHWMTYAELPLPDVLSVSGRSEGCLFLCGTNLFESQLQNAFLKTSFAARSSGLFVVWTEAVQGQQILHWQIELRDGQSAPTPSETRALHRELVEQLSAQQPEFALDYEKFYSSSEAEGLSVFRFTFSPAAHLSQHPRFVGAIKRKVILDHGPV